MNCMNCQTPVTKGTEYCPKCGFHVLSQRKAVYLSKLYYNQGLEKASVRDLSGAITCLKQSLKFSKLNIQARNLLGLVYFETGEVVAALCEWVISKNLMPHDNLATTYIEKLQSNPSKLEMINRTVNKYNVALAYCQQGNEDMAAILLKKILTQNPKLIKGYHLLALLQIREGSYAKARRTLKKALKIDKTNTTTLRFLREVDEQTGMTTDLSGKTRKVRGAGGEEGEHKRMVKSGNDFIILPPVFRESSTVGFCINLGLGVLIGAAALWFLVVPAKTQQAYDAVNQQILNSEGVLGEQKEREAMEEEHAQAISAAESQLTQANARIASTEKLMQAYRAMNNGDYNQASEYLREVRETDLSDANKLVYQTVNSAVNGVTVPAGDTGAEDGE